MRGTEMTVIRAAVGAMADPGNLRAGASRVEYTKLTPPHVFPRLSRTCFAFHASIG